MITLETLLTQLKPESLNEIVAGCGSFHWGGKSSKSGHNKSSHNKSSHNKSSKNKSSKNHGCACTPPPPPCGGCI